MLLEWLFLVAEGQTSASLGPQHQLGRHARHDGECRVLCYENSLLLSPHQFEERSFQRVQKRMERNEERSFRIISRMRRGRPHRVLASAVSRVPVTFSCRAGPRSTMTHSTCFPVGSLRSNNKDEQYICQLSTSWCYIT